MSLRALLFPGRKQRWREGDPGERLGVLLEGVAGGEAALGHIVGEKNK